MSTPTLHGISSAWLGAARIVGAVWLTIIVVVLAGFAVAASDVSLRRMVRFIAAAAAAAVTAYAIGIALAVTEKQLDLVNGVRWAGLVLLLSPGLLCGGLFRRPSAVAGVFVGATALALTGMYVLAAYVPATLMGMTPWSWALLGHHFSCSPAAFLAWLFGAPRPSLEGWEGWGAGDVDPSWVMLMALLIGGANAVSALAAWWVAQWWARRRVRRAEPAVPV